MHKVISAKSDHCVNATPFEHFSVLREIKREQTSILMQSRQQPTVRDTVIHNRIAEVMAHTTRYAFKCEARLAMDAGISKSALNRLVNGLSSPSFVSACKIARALEKELKRPLEPRELISFDGTYPTPSVCELVGCKGCMPDQAYDESERVRPQYREIKPGDWSTMQVA
jgi:transcriptional regulator with XRE-family HTH domain